MPDFEIVAENLRVAMRFFGEATGSGEICPLDGADAIYSGLDYGVFNIAMLSNRVGASAAALDARIADCGRYYRSHSVRWSFWICEEFLDVAVRRRAGQAFADWGMRPISRPPGMIADALPPPSRTLPKLELRGVDDQAARDTFAGITSVSFDIPSHIARAVYQPERAWRNAYRGYIGLAGGRPVGVGASVVAADAVGIYSLATIPECRGQGYGEALIRSIVAEETPRAATSRVVLQSTEAGHGLYRRLGFRDVAKFSVYLTK
jgi:GNAT superfamily N-acetyltransferase